MDRDTRNSIERATQRARSLLEDDFAAQLEGDFDVHRDDGVAAKAGPHLSARQVFQRERIVAAIEHKRAAKMSALEAVADYLRGAAFTTLNRFVALKMLEARGLLQECITKGELSSGYREFCGMAPGLALLADSVGYRLYIESLFDELATEVKVLFDRRDPASVLWPKRATFEQLLEILNAGEISEVWGDDETIGWVYQFFNDSDERRKMRQESQAPRNSRELAVRNQFFTPRYVVQFLTDNTLGRIWYEMRGTQTALAERCRYMVCRPGEQVAHRSKKDPRDLRLLDPACGSGHFLLYAFDLLLSIYEEAFADLESPKCEATGRTLAEDYSSLDSLRKATPGLILAHNIHGVDIDPRCAQIAQLALWMRAQRAYRDYRVERADRPQIRRSNLVVAEPMPGEAELRSGFMRQLPTELAQLVARVFDSMQLAGEAGSLLKVDEEVHSAIQDVYRPFGELFRQSDEERWQEAESRLRAELSRYLSETGDTKDTRRRLFAEDTDQGLGFIDTFSRRYDVIVMNPPFGAGSLQAKEYTDRAYDQWRHDVGPCFVSRMCDLLSEKGIVGALTPRTYFTLTRLAAWRSRYLLGGTTICVLADLGFKVLDGAMVEVAAYCCSKDTYNDLVAIDCLGARDDLKSQTLRDCVAEVKAGHPSRGTFSKKLSSLRGVPQMRLVYWATDNLVGLFQKHESLDNGESRVVREGLHTGDNERSLRLWWEVNSAQQDWRPFPKGGEYCTFYSDVDLVVDWRSAGRDVLASSHGVVPSREYYFRAGLTYTRRTASGISFRVLPEGAIFSSTGPLVWASSETEILALLSFLMSRPARALVEYLVGGGDSAVSRGAARDFMTGLVSALPCPKWPTHDQEELAAAGFRCWRDTREHYRFDETDAAYAPRWTDEESLHTLVQRHSCDVVKCSISVLETTWTIEKRLCAALGLDADDLTAITDAVGEHPAGLEHRPVPEEQAAELAALDDDDLVDRVARFHRMRDATKQFHFAHRRVELVSRALRTHPRVLEKWFATPRTSDYVSAAWAYLSWLTGRCFGRWRDTETKDCQASTYAPFAAIVRPVPHVAVGADLVLDILVDDEGHRHDVCRRLEEIAQESLPRHGALYMNEALQMLGYDRDGLREAMKREFFAQHLLQYSKARRRAPIYWQLATPSASYSVWLYIHAFTDDTLFRLQNDYVAPKLAHEERRLETMVREQRERDTAAERKALAAQSGFVEELRAFFDEVKRVAPLWKLSLNDGVILSFAPLWRLVPQHKVWQKELKETWQALCDEKYDWAHLAMHLWPERVVPKCATDRSLAIAHELEDVFWLEESVGKWTARETPTRPIDELVRERTSPAVKAALKNLLEAPLAAGIRGGGSRRRAAAVADGRAH